MSIRRIHALFRVAPAATAFLLATAACAGDLAGDVRAKLKASQLNEANIGYMVIDVATGKTVASHNETIARMPASNMKVLTTGAALDVLGPNFEFRTRLIAATNAGKTTLTIVGDGDPALFDPEAHGGNWTTVSDAVNAWAANLKAAGVVQVDEVVVDARIFDSEPIPTGDEKWATNLNGTYAVELWGLNIAANTARVGFGWQSGAAPTIASVDPPFPLRSSTESRARCVAGTKSTFDVQNDDTPGQLVLQGNMANTAGDKDKSISVRNTPLLAAEMFANEFRRCGIAVPPGAFRVAQPTDPATTGAVVPPVLTTPIATVIKRANTDSVNLYAEALAKRVGAARSGKAGSWVTGREAVQSAITARIGAVGNQQIKLFDGSGLSKENMVSPAVIASWLRSLASDSTKVGIYYSSFARPHEPGTLKKRFDGVDFDGIDVFGKSGYIDCASCLSGLVVGPGGKAMVYSILCRSDNWKAEGKLTNARAFQEQLVVRVAEEIKRDGVKFATAAGH